MKSIISMAWAMIFFGSSPFAACAPDAVELRQGDLSVRFTVEVADTHDERARGLMFRETMPRFSGMLFVYEDAQPVSFWMKNTLIPLDMLFLDDRGVVQSIAREAVPHDLTPIFGGQEILQVLEINGGLADQLGLDVGAELRHPSLDQSRAAWPCEAPG